MSVKSPMLDSAWDYIARGWTVIPLRPGGKEPLTTHGVKDRSSDPAQIREWWERWPDANVGIATGEASGIFVVDFDPRNVEDRAEYDELVELCRATGAPEVATGGGGTHFYFAYSGDKYRGKLIDGVDIKSEGGYVVGPPSTHPSGGQYLWKDYGDVYSPPSWLSEAISKRDEGRAPREHDPSDNRPGTRFNNECTWEELLEPAGWKLVDSNGGEDYWRRPGKDQGFSATTNYENTDLLYVFTSSTPFEPNRGYDKVGAYAVLNFDGDVDAALEDIIATWTGPTLRMEVPAKTSAKATGSTENRPYSFDPALDPDHLISRYIAYAEQQTDAALEYHEAAALVLLSVCTTNLKANLAPYPGGLGTNLYMILVGATTRSRKSTAQAIATDIAEAVAPYSVLPSRVTTEALVGLLAAKSGVSSLWLPDEFGMTIAEIGRRDFLRGIEELLLSLYGGKEYVYTKVSDTIVVRHPHLSVLGAATPESLGLAGPTAMLGGLLPRFGVVLPESLPEARPASSIDEAVLSESRRGVIQSLRAVTQFADEHRTVTFTPDAVKVLNHAESSMVDAGAHIARLPAMLYKVAALIAAGRMSTEVSESDATGAAVIVNRWKDGANRLQPFLRRKSGDIEFSRQMFATLDALKELGGNAHRSQVARRIGLAKPKVDAIQASLVDQGYITVDKTAGEWTVRE